MKQPAIIGVLATILANLLGCASISPDMQRAAKINTQLGVEYLKQGNLEQALKKLERAIEEDPNLPSAYNALALLRQRLGQNKEAEKEFHRAIKLDSTNSEAQNNYGVFLYEQGRYQEAENHFLEAIKNPFYSTPALAYENAGSAAQKSGDDEKAETYYRKALQLEPNLAESLYHLAEISFKQDRYQNAQKYLQRHQIVARPTARSLWLSVRVERKLNHEEDAARYALLLKQQFPASSEAQLLRWIEYGDKDG
ncbi:type IV pilus biogenesis/stability protein PilW [Candidatus Nitrosoglobus terrae]|uniref:type IV pilus biogenesis/stability protein PilW n=1 Tax=Candidatus Nitrosoglobus terrae TaxID=1630141 RepID=UPI001E41EC65|nr:type IV pilus biogenesis/stability protein PilW [Candidatus Nitrosoglobus terrae]